MFTGRINIFGAGVDEVTEAKTCSEYGGTWVKGATFCPTGQTRVLGQISEANKKANPNAICCYEPSTGE